MKKIFSFFLFFILFSPALEATPKLGSQPVRTLEKEKCFPWERIECWKDDNHNFQEEKFLPTTQHLMKSIFGVGVYEAFGTTMPHSKYFLLHYGPKWKEATKEVPILLVHGASSDATRSYASYYFDGSKGLMHRLSAQGFAVFAITFPCGQGNLYYQAEHIANALSIIEKRTGAKKVDIICHSAGGISTRMYLTSIKKSWGTTYRGDVRKVIFVATPHKGIDFIFRHPIAFIRFWAYGMPCPWDWYSQMGNMGDKNLFCGAYPMQLQLLNDLSADYKLKTGEPDWHTTYYGGRGLVSKCKGIHESMRMGGNHMAKVRSGIFSKDLEVYLMAGTKKNLKYHDLQGKTQEEEGEYHGESDGILFVKSAIDLDGLKKSKAHIVAYKIFPMNHVELLFYNESVEWILSCLNSTVKTNP